MSRRLIIYTIIATAIVVAGSAILLRRQAPLISPQSSKSAAPLVDSVALNKLATKDASKVDTSHLDSSIIPPTNSWLSGAVLQKTPLPVYPMPLSVLMRDNGIEVGLPTVTATQTTINGGHVSGIHATIANAITFQMTRYDGTSASLSYKDKDGVSIGTTTITEGVPYVYYRSHAGHHITLRDVTVPSIDTTETYLRYTKAGHDYVVIASNGATISMRGITAEINAPNNSLVTYYALPNGEKDQLRTYAANEIKAVTTSYATQNNNVSTKFHYTTSSGNPTAYAAMGYATTMNVSKPLTSYETIYGNMITTSGNDLVTTAPRTTPSNSLDITKISDEHRQSLKKLLQQDVASTKITAMDSYYAGKQLARAANLLDIAHQLNDQPAATRLQEILADAMTQRLNGGYFYYDTKVKGVAASTAAFGSEDFNDHHFHYGYIIYAASILGRYDPQFLRDHINDINLLIADIAAYDKSATFPVRRNYDAYAGHAWAAGLAPFVDGNNQESSSEAMNAWNAVSLWGKLIGNSTLTEEGDWMLANEAAAAHRIWRSPPTNLPNTSAFTSPLTSLNFSGKRTYATFFSDEPNAKLGIQLIPMAPYMHSMPDDVIDIQRLDKSTIKDNNYNVALGDYILMYSSIYDPARAIKLLDEQQDKFIDDGNSRTYLSAFIYTQLSR